MKNYTAYYRVSTQKQGKSGLGLDGQKTSVNNFIGSNNLLMEFVEVESGKNNDRPELKKAIDYAKKTGSILLIAKLDRLSRNASFILSLRDSGVDFVCCDMPDATPFTIGIFALLAQQEREMISSRTKVALQAKIAQGFKLGSPVPMSDEVRKMGVAKRKVIANENTNNQKAAAFIKSLKTQNLSLRAIADILNNAGFRTSKNQLFQATTVKRLADKISK